MTMLASREDGAPDLLTVLAATEPLLETTGCAVPACPVAQVVR